MPALPEATLFWCAVAIQLAGLFSMVLSRLSRSGWYQAVYLVCLLIIGAATMWTTACGSDYWMSFGATLAAMCVGAILDFRHSFVPARTW